MHKRLTSRNAAGKELALLVDARAVAFLARKLLADAGESLALYDAVTPWDGKQVGYGKGVLTARIAAGHAFWAQRQLELGEDFDEANIRLRLAKRAFGLAEEIAKDAKIMASIRQAPPSGPVEEQ